MKLRRLAFGVVAVVSLFMLRSQWAAPAYEEDSEEADLVWIDPTAGDALRGEDDYDRELEDHLLRTLGNHWLSRNGESVPSSTQWLPLALSGGRIVSFDAESFEVIPVSIRGEALGSAVRLPIVKERDQRHFEIESDRPEPVIVTVEFIELTSPPKGADEEELAYHQRALDLVKLLNDR
ncbi:MAG: hypothetical protein RL885_09855 [Planctomycetota bacterium]